jgi:hypothetical protein
VKTSLSDLQACVAITKLRPGGLLWWTRDEPLDERAGPEVLALLFEKAKLVCEWNFTETQHSLPTTGKQPFPRYLYLFSREPRIEERLGHRPMRVALRGQVRSHVEVPLFLEDALVASQKQVVPRGQWSIQANQSPTAQREWLDHWPEATAHSEFSKLEALKEASLPLASATTIRPTPEGDPKRAGAWNTHGSAKGFWVSSEGRTLVCQALPSIGEETTGSGFLVLVSDENVIAPLRHYLESELIREWLDHRCERKGDRWVLTEQVVRWIPVRKALLKSLKLGTACDGDHPRPRGRA